MSESVEPIRLDIVTPLVDGTGAVALPHRASTALPMHEVDCTVYGWLTAKGREAGSIQEVLQQVSDRLVSAGIPLVRTSLVLRTLHPEILATAYIWKQGGTQVEEFQRAHQTQRADAYARSPVRAIFDGLPGLRRKISDPQCPRDFSILDDLEQDGITDYLVLPVPFGDGARYSASFATAASEGFTDTQLNRIAAIMPVYSLVLEVLSGRRIATNLLDTYIGRSTGRRVLAGDIMRGANETIEAVICVNDLRGFTALSDRQSTEQIIDLLNAYFGIVVPAIQERGGEVLKFMGDAVLAIFPLAEFADQHAAAATALDAMLAARETTSDANRSRAEAELPPIDFDSALHIGEVSYGNIGAPDRLDFTVIGPAVNLSARLEGLCRTMDRSLLASSALASALPEQFTSLGFHALEGMREPQEIFALK